MRQLVAITVILVLATTLPAFADRSEEVGAAVAVPSPEPVAGPSWPGPRGAVLVDNGPLVNVPGGGAGGADLSMLENVTLGMTSLGLANQGPGDTGNRVSDDFTVTGEGWILDECTFYAYQTGAPNAPSPISAINVQVWDGAPDDPASMVVAGDLTTNIQTDSAWSNIYRAAEDDTAGTLRAIFAITADMGGLELAAGDYWFDWAPTGSATFSGPWAPPIAILGQTSTGNAKQFFAGAWQDVEDGGTLTPLGLPFVCTGQEVIDAVPPTDIPTLSQVGLIAMLLALAGFGIVRMRRS